MNDRYYSAVVALILSGPVVPLADAQTQGWVDGDSFDSDKRRLDVIRVRADRQPEDPGGNSVLGAELIESVSASHAAEIVNVAPGANVQINSGQDSLIGLRSPVLNGGAGQGSVLLLDDAAPTRAFAFGNVNALFELHHETAEAIEVVRGPGSVKYGSNAVHGLINVLQTDPNDATDFLALSGSSLGVAKMDGRAGYRGERSGGYAALSLQSDHGWRSDSGLDMQKLSLRHALEVEAWDVRLGVSAVNLNQETAGFIKGYKAYEDEDISKSNASPEAYRDAESVRLQMRASRPVGGVELVVFPYAISQRMDFALHFLPYGGLEENGHDALGLKLQLSENRGQEIVWTIGTEGQIADGFLRETQFVGSFGPFPQGLHYDYGVETDMVALFGELSFPVGRHTRVLGGIRAEWSEYDYDTKLAPGDNGRFRVPADRRDSFSFVSPKVGAVWNGWEPVELYVNVARSQRSPQASDLYRLQTTQTVGDIRVEQLDSAEIGARGVTWLPRTDFDVTGFAMRKENYFFRDADGLNVVDGRTTHIGVEAALSGLFAERWSWRASAAYAEHRYDFDRSPTNATEVIRSGDLIDTAPKWLGTGGVRYLADRWTAEVSVNHVGRYYTDAANSHEYSGHVIANARLDIDVSGNLKAWAAVKNLADADYADRADYAFGSDRYFPGEPINVTVGFKLTN